MAAPQTRGVPDAGQGGAVDQRPQGSVLVPGFRDIGEDYLDTDMNGEQSPSLTEVCLAIKVT